MVCGSSLLATTFPSSIHRMILRVLAAFLLLSFVLSEETQDTVPSFVQFVYTYGKQYKEDEYAYERVE